ncbi:hypothetical protein EDB81DRAFT_654684 [Dactylonectria macrodidyma]|uniref:Uncharacterized protein n=1 Tax=Dactylonectria macrodidyma TaxID=307937 RepID=A0A9P9EP51_9HYPO|nr:hypothetical protein EDB81DRAFT_654684 [Dactylonectria macrodidyma]
MSKSQLEQPGNFIGRFYKRLKLIGLLSLAALFVGSLILILVVFNAGYEYLHPTDPNYTEFGRFRIGWALDVQTWLAIVGVGFGLVSYGLQEGFTHFVDLWCSLQASKHSGLDYKRYLNSQPRAPVLLGMRGFPVIVNLQRLMALIAIGSSIGYKFGIARGTTPELSDISGPIGSWPEAPSYRDVRMVFEGGRETVPSWFYHDFEVEAGIRYARAFRHKLDGNLPDEEPPINIVMTSAVACAQLFTFDVRGDVYFPQFVLIANRTEEVGLSTMTKDSTGWFRTETTNLTWITQSTESVAMVVDYRVLEPDSIQIQWARFGNWYTDNIDGSSAEEPVVRRFTYKIFPATWIVPRFMLTGYDDCATLTNNTEFGHFFDLAISIDATPLQLGNETLVDRRWLDAFIYNPQTTMRDGVAAFVRAAMSGAFVAAARNSAYTWPDEDYVTKINKSDIIGLTSPPYFRGSRIIYPTVIRHPAQVVYLAVGILAFLVGILRIWLGPPKLTSWMGQHVYLALGGMVTISERPMGLRLGYEVASGDFGRL